MGATILLSISKQSDNFNLTYFYIYLFKKLKNTSKIDKLCIF